jgi:hypothetical protein
MKRQTVAAGLIRAVQEAEHKTQAIGSSLPIQHEAVRRCRDDLLDLARRLQSEQPASELAITLASKLLTEVDSPLYEASGDLRGAVRRALAALDGRHGEVESQ